MSRLQLNKSSLAKQSKDLQSFTRYLPSLDLKRQQLMAEKSKATAQIRALEKDLEALFDRVQRTLPMLANEDIDLDGLVVIKQVNLSDENVVGVHLPVLKNADIGPENFPLISKPHWVDNYIKLQSQALLLTLKIRIAKQREDLLKQAVKTITQRVNLFEKVLIPQAKQNIKRIKIYLSDEQMAAVVRSKIAKKKRLAAGNVI